MTTKTIKVTNAWKDIKITGDITILVNGKPEKFTGVEIVKLDQKNKQIAFNISTPFGGKMYVASNAETAKAELTNVAVTLPITA